MAEVSILHRFMGREFAARLLNYAIASEALFASTTVRRDGRNVEAQTRRSLHHVVPQDFVDEIGQAVDNVLPRVLNELGIRAFSAASYEIELVAHGDGGFYQRHIDTFTGGNRPGAGDRIVSCVYYFQSQPKRFSGGQLRLYPLSTRVAPAPEPIDVAPEHDTLVAFSSWMPHEVMPTMCPTQRFEDYRFSINCWVYQQSDPASAQNV
jgi:SM-20-related protein